MEYNHICYLRSSASKDVSQGPRLGSILPLILIHTLGFFSAKGTPTGKLLLLLLRPSIVGLGEPRLRGRALCHLDLAGRIALLPAGQRVRLGIRPCGRLPLQEVRGPRGEVLSINGVLRNINSNLYFGCLGSDHGHTCMQA